MTRTYMRFRSHGPAALPFERGCGGNDSNELVTRKPCPSTRGETDRSLVGTVLDYWMRLITLNIGMYRAMTAAPTAPPITAIRSGSMSDVRASTVAVTSLL
jgi:hypothetical protein